MQRAVLIAALCIAFVSNVARAEEHALGMPHMIFCDAFVAKISKKMPMPYADFIKFTDGEGMPVAPNRRHWDGEKNSYLSIDLHLNFVKGGLVTCPNGDEKSFGVWDAPSN